MDNKHLEESFLSLCGLTKYKTIEHNLSYWNIDIINWVENDSDINITLNVPYGEFSFEIQNNLSDINFFLKPTTKITWNPEYIKPSDSISDYLFSRKYIITIKNNTKYLLFNSPYFYPHNWYYFSNREYLFNKIINSLNYFKHFISAYKSCFSNGVPLLYIHSTNETIKEYEINIIIKDVINIFYIKTDIENKLIYLNILFEKSTMQSKYHKIKITIPRLLQSSETNFIFSSFCK